MGNQRALLDFNNDTKTIDITELAGKSGIKKNAVDSASVQQVAEESGFPSREGITKTRRRWKSPFTMKLGMKCRPEIRDLFQNMSEYLDVYDHTTFEHALLALIKNEGTKEHLKLYEEAVQWLRVKPNQKNHLKK